MRIDSIAALAIAKPKIDTATSKEAVNVFMKQPNSPEQLTVLENNKIKITFTQ